MIVKSFKLGFLVAAVSFFGCHSQKQVPVSTMLTNRPSVVVYKNAIFAQGKKIAPIIGSDVAVSVAREGSGHMGISPLIAELKANAAAQKGAKAYDGSINIVFDKTIPFTLFESVLYSSTMSGYGSYQTYCLNCTAHSSPADVVAKAGHDLPSQAAAIQPASPGKPVKPAKPVRVKIRAKVPAPAATP